MTRIERLAVWLHQVGAGYVGGFCDTEAVRAKAWSDMNYHDATAHEADAAALLAILDSEDEDDAGALAPGSVEPS